MTRPSRGYGRWGDLEEEPWGAALLSRRPTNSPLETSVLFPTLSDNNSTPCFFFFHRLRFVNRKINSSLRALSGLLRVRPPPPPPVSEAGRLKQGRPVSFVVSYENAGNQERWGNGGRRTETNVYRDGRNDESRLPERETGVGF